jgi:N-terminal acetyltransferase B complex catalytic subunit
MCSTRSFTTDDLFRFNHINLDKTWTETYNMAFYLKYLENWPEMFIAQESPCGRLFAYVMGKMEGSNQLWHGHVTAITVAPDYRKLGSASSLMKHLESVSEQNQCYFVDLFVRKSNSKAIEFYKKRNFVIYREIKDYYSGPNIENAYDMRLALSRDVNKTSIIPVGRIVKADEIEFN